MKKALLLITLAAGILAVAPVSGAPQDYAGLDPYSMERDDLAKTYESLLQEYEALYAQQEQEDMPETEAVSTEPAAAAEKVEEGQHKVGTDIPAGDYVIFRSNSNMSGYYFLTRDANGNDYIDSDGFDNNAIVYCPEGSYLELSNSYAIPLESNPEIDTSGDGTFIVGLHIPAGEYKVERISDSMSGYYFIYTDTTHEGYVGSDSFDGSVYVNLSDGQVLQLSNSRLVM